MKKKFSNILFRLDQPLSDVIKVLDRTGYGVVIVVNSFNQLLGTITDGDIRRAMLKGISFETACSVVCNRIPVFAKQTSSREELKKLFDNNEKHCSLDQIPLLNDKGEVVDVALRKDYMLEPKKNNWVVIMAGGLGSRLLPLTRDCPKPLAQVAGRPVLELLIESFIEEGFTRFLISVNYKAELIEKALGNGHRWGVDIHYVMDPKRLGTAGPLSLMRDWLTDQPFFVINADMLTKLNFSKVLDFHTALTSDVTLCVKAHEYKVPYGVVELSDHRLVHIQEKPVHSCFVSTGIYVVSPSVMEFVPDQTYLDMHELLTILLQRKQSVNSYPIHEYWMDIGRIEDLECAHREYHTVFSAEP